MATVKLKKFIEQQNIPNLSYNEVIKSRGEYIIKQKMLGFTYQEISEELGISRQRVQQIVKPPNKIVQYLKTKTNNSCEICGIKLGQKNGHLHHKGTGDNNYNDVLNLQYLCIQCHRRQHILAEALEALNNHEK